MPRGRLPSGAVAITACVAASITVRSPDVSLVTNARSGGGGRRRRLRRALAAGDRERTPGADNKCEQRKRTSHHGRMILRGTEQARPPQETKSQHLWGRSLLRP